MARNVPNPGETIVPSARAERRRLFADDTSGIAIYAIVVTLVVAAVVAIVLFA
jgi:hypothetical protein